MHKQEIANTHCVPSGDQKDGRAISVEVVLQTNKTCKNRVYGFKKKNKAIKKIELSFVKPAVASQVKSPGSANRRKKNNNIIFRNSH